MRFRPHSEDLPGRLDRERAHKSMRHDTACRRERKEQKHAQAGRVKTALRDPGTLTLPRAAMYDFFVPYAVRDVAATAACDPS